MSFGMFFLIRSIVNTQKCASDTLGMLIPDAASGAAKIQMIQLQNYRQWDVSLPADLWLFLGKSSKPPLLLSPPLEIIREYISFFFFSFFFTMNTFFSLPALQEGNRAVTPGTAAPLPRAVVAARAGRHPGVPAVPGHTCARKGEHDPVGLSHPPGEDLHRLAPGFG